MKKLFIISSLLAAASFSCEKAVDVDVPFEKPKLVLNGYLNPDSTISVHVGKSQFILDEAPLQNIMDANVNVYEGDQLLGTLQHQENGIYKLDGVYPQIGKTYTIAVEREGFPAAKAQQVIPPAIHPMNLTINEFKIDEFGQTGLNIEFEVQDPAEEKNFYFIRVFEKGVGIHRNYLGDTIRQPYFVAPDLESPDPILESFCPEWNGCGLLISDDYFNGKTYRMKLTARSHFWYSEVEHREFYFGLYHVPESFYLFYKTLENNQDTRDNPFAEPAKVFTNIEGGYGLWSSFSPSIFKIEKE